MHGGQPDASYMQSVPETPTFTFELGPEPPIFHFAAAHTYQNMGVSIPPPPGLKYRKNKWLEHLLSERGCFISDNDRRKTKRGTGKGRKKSKSHTSQPGGRKKVW